MSALHYGAATLHNGLRHDADMPRTPEPLSIVEEQLHSPPRPRFKLKKRNASSHLRAPTEQFLASVAAADVPIPSVEEPDFANADEAMADNFPDLKYTEEDDDLNIFHHLRRRAFSPPKTPALDLAPSLSPTKYPNWSIDSAWDSSDLESSPDYESSRPSTAFSTQTTSSLFSRFSHPSEDGDCISPDADKGSFDLAGFHNDAEAAPRRKPRRAPWTKAMDAHLWSTYMLYLQDPKVTPFYQGKSCIPPTGVCARVARQAKRSWKGSKQSAVDAKSGSSTPTAESSKPYMEWPHTGAVTRAHLRELCKVNVTTKQSRTPFVSGSPAPFAKAAHRRWNRRSTPARSPSVFSAQEISMSLTLSTSEAMQPQGPLAMLTSSRPERDLFRTPEPKTDHSLEVPPAANRVRLGSPFFAKSYGPSSSTTLAENINPIRQSQTVGPRKLLNSPARLTRSRSGTQKRRSVKVLDEQPRKRRPSLAAALFGPPANTAGPSVESPGCALFSSTDSSETDKLFIPRTTAADPFAPLGTLAHASSSYTDMHSLSSMSTSIPTRLGSPFTTSNTSHSFPNRLSQPVNFNLAAFRRPFATVQQASDAGADISSARSSLSSRLAYIDQRLRDLRNRSTRRRSHSPPA